ncbi:hypothetical protein B0H14DRAFT_2379722, partial [Mycena olivaceomarginata]
VSGHSLAIERRRWKERGKKIVPRQWHLCRFCYIYVEDPTVQMRARRTGTNPRDIFSELIR